MQAMALSCEIVRDVCVLRALVACALHAVYAYMSHRAELVGGLVIEFGLRSSSLVRPEQSFRRGW